jgi:type VI secretion system protein VasD
MNRGRLLATLGALVLLAACGGDELPPPPAPPPPPPTIVSLTLRASADLNPDASGVAKPLRVRVLKLASGNTFAEADFFALNGNLEKTLGSDLKGTEELVLTPGSTQVWQAKLDQEVKVLGLMGAYHAIDQAQWRTWKEIPRNATTLLAAELGRAGIVLREAAP